MGLRLDRVGLGRFWTSAVQYLLDGQLSTEAGCFKWYSGYGSFAFFDHENFTMATCLESCTTEEKKFSIIDAGRSCMCANTLPTSDVVSNSECNYLCTGEPGTRGKCGGSYRWNIHAITP